MTVDWNRMIDKAIDVCFKAFQATVVGLYVLFLGTILVYSIMAIF